MYLLATKIFIRTAIFLIYTTSENYLYLYLYFTLIEEYQRTILRKFWTVNTTRDGRYVSSIAAAVYQRQFGHFRTMGNLSIWTGGGGGGGVAQMTICRCGCFRIRDNLSTTRSLRAKDNLLIVDMFYVAGRSWNRTFPLYRRVVAKRVNPNEYFDHLTAPTIL